MRRADELTPAQKWEAATLADNFIFCKVMAANPGFCKELLELLLGIEIDRIEHPAAEHSLKIDYGSKGIRFDVYVKDGTGRCFDIEVQTTKRKNIARRSRYYQSLMDVDALAAGADYGDLKDGYVIFLCLDDPFGRGLPVYRFTNTCAEDASVSLGDGAHKIFYNAAKHDIMPGEALRSFFRFLAGAADDGSALSGRLDAMVSRAKTNAQWRHQFMTWEQEMRIQVRERAEELAQERAEELAAQKAVETARKLLDMALASEQIAEATGLPLEQVERLRQESSAV
ncbi:MAG: Rpn family recombination-promoting nuclease/putative transposase [Treponemataceae bacterium]|nr:Rpn family recombination-promoting nuclease/putative transposase [Treponemataceae bacterium]